MNIDFLKVCSDVTKTARKIPQSQYLSSGQYPIFDQGQKTISGYYNDAGNIANDFPYIVFGDHTRVLKYVNEPCYIGADGVKLLKIINNDFVPKYVFYALLANPVNSQGYSRHFKFLKEKKIKIASKKEQHFIIEKLDSIKKSIELKENELKSLDELVKSRFIEMFGHYFEDVRYFVKVGDIATATIGLTYKPDNVTDEGIIVLRSGNIQNAELCLSDDIVRV